MFEGASSKWKVFIARSLYLVLGFAEQRSFGEMLPVYVLTFHTSVTLAGWSLTMITGLAYLLTPLVKVLIEQTSLRLVAVVGGIVYGASFVILGLTGQNIWHVFALHTAVGLSSAAVNLATYLAIGEHFDKKFGMANSASFLIAATIGSVFPLLLLYFEVTYGLRWTLMLYGALSLNLVPVGIWVTSPKEKSIGSVTAENMLRTTQNSQTSLLRAHPSILFLFALYGVTYTVSVGFSLTLYPFGIEKGFDMDIAALLISFYSIGSLFGRLYVFLMFTWNMKTNVSVVIAPILVTITMTSVAIISSNIVLAGLGAFFGGYATGTMNTWSSSIVREVACETHFSSAAAWLTTCGGIGATFAGLWAGWIHGIQGSYQHVMVFYVALNVIQLLLSLPILVFSRDESSHAPPCRARHNDDSDVSEVGSWLEMEEVCAERWKSTSENSDEEELLFNYWN